MDLNITVFVIYILLHNCGCDYPCLCNYNLETSVYKNADNAAAPVGALYDYDCNTFISDVIQLWATIVYHQEVAFVEKNAQTIVQMCHGEIPDEDMLALTLNQLSTTRALTRSTSHKPATTIPNTSTQTSTILAKNTPLNTTSSTYQTNTIPTSRTTTSAYLLEGHIESCPDYIRNTDVNRYHGFLGQYGEYCYELVDAPTQWINAERHWTTYQYKNFGADFASHSEYDHDLNDCVVMKQGGEWTDVPCGIAAVLGLGFGESHPYICQYNISYYLPSIVDTFPHAIVG